MEKFYVETGYKIGVFEELSMKPNGNLQKLHKLMLESDVQHSFQFHLKTILSITA